MVPDLFDYVIGFRQWALARVVKPDHMQEGLWAISQKVKWSKSMRARCLANGRHHAPDNDCECGLYARHDMGYPAGLQSGCGYGAIKAWGRMQIHADGFRAEKAEVIALTFGGYWSEAGLDLVHRVANIIDVPVVPLEELASVAFEHGTPIDKSLRPSWPRVMPNWKEAA